MDKWERTLHVNETFVSKSERSLYLYPPFTYETQQKFVIEKIIKYNLKVDYHTVCDCVHDWYFIFSIDLYTYPTLGFHNNHNFKMFFII